LTLPNRLRGPKIIRRAASLSARNVLIAAVLLISLAGGSESTQAEPGEPHRFELAIRDGRVIASPGTIRVARGARVTLRWIADRPTVLHLHGYDIELALVPAVPTEMSFDARATGFRSSSMNTGRLAGPGGIGPCSTWKCIHHNGVRPQCSARRGSLLPPEPLLRPSAVPEVWRTPMPLDSAMICHCRWASISPAPRPSLSRHSCSWRASGLARPAMSIG
jgi:hypothetical protein